jgi:hypothetical protein
MEAADGSEHVQDTAGVAPPVNPAFAGELGQADGRPASGWPAGTSSRRWSATSMVYVPGPAATGQARGG